MRFKVTLFFSGLLLLSLEGAAQFPISPNAYGANGKRTGHWTILYDSTFTKEVSDPDSVFYYRLIRFENGKPSGKVRDFYRNGFRQWDGYLISVTPDVFGDGESNAYYESGKLQHKRVYKDQKLNGFYQEYSQLGKILTKGGFKDDLLEGLFTYYGEDGNKKAELIFQKDKKEGSGVFYHTNGKVSQRNFYKNNLVDGWVEERDEKGAIVFRSYYSAGKANGSYETYFPNGAIKKRGTYKDDKQHDIWIENTENGVRISEGSYLDDVKSGNWETYYVTGKPESGGSYKKGLKNSLWFYYHPNGQVKSKGQIIDDLASGKWEYFYEDGRLSSKGFYKNNLAEGEWISYYSNSKISERSNYRLDTANGTFINYYQNGVIKSVGEKKLGKSDGNWKFYFDNKLIKAEGVFELDTRVGLWTYYLESGTIDAIKNYKNDLLEGESINHYPNGKLKDKAFYHAGMKEGEYAEYYETGLKKEQSFYRNNLFEGERLEYFSTGELKSRRDYAAGLYNGRFESFFENGKAKLIATTKSNGFEGSLVRFFSNGSRSEQGDYLNGRANGLYTFYDSATNALSRQGNYSEDKRNGVWVSINAKGRNVSKTYYVFDFEETQRNVQDSVQSLIDRRDYPAALKTMKWMERVTKRDIKNSSQRALVSHMYGKIHSASGDYEQALNHHSIYLKALTKYNESGKSYKDAVHNVATSLHGLQRYDEALKLYDRVIDLAKPDGLVKSYWASVNNKVYCLYDAKRPKEAATLLEDELAKAKRRYADSSGGWYIRHEAAEYYYDRPGDYQRAQGLFLDLTKDIRKYQQLNNNLVYKSYRRLSQLNGLLSQPMQAVAYTDSTIAYAERNGLTQLPEYAESLMDYYNSTTNMAMKDSSTLKNQYVAIRKIAEFIPHTTNHSLLSKLYQLLATAAYKFGEYNHTGLLSAKAEEEMIKVKTDNTERHANLLQTWAFALLYSKERSMALAEQKLLQSVDIRKKLNNNATSYITSKIELGGFYHRTDQYNKALKILEETIPLVENAGQTELLARAQKYLGEVYLWLGQYDKAVESFKKSRAHYELHPEKFGNYLLEIADEVSTCYTFLENFEQARAMAERAYSIASDLYGVKSSQVYERAGDIGFVYQHFNLFSEAQKYYKQQADGYKERLGVTSDQYLISLTKLSSVFREKGEFQKSYDLMMPFIPKDTVMVNKNSSKIIKEQLRELVEICNGLNLSTEEEMYRKRQVAVLKQLYGEANATYALALMALGDFYSAHNRIDEAEDAATKSVTAIRSTDWAKSAFAVNYLGRLAKIKSGLDKNREAEELFLETISLAERDTVNNPVYYEGAVADIADFFAKMGRYQEAEKTILKLTEFMERRHGRDFGFSKARASLIWAYYNQRKYKEAREEAGVLIKLAEEEYGVNHWLTLSIHNYLGIIAGDENDFVTSKREYQNFIDGYLAIPTPTISNIGSLAVGYSNLAAAQINLNEVDEAEVNLKKCERLRKESNIKASINNRISTLASWTKIHESKGDFQKAEAEWSEIVTILLSYARDNFYYLSDQEKAEFWKSKSGNFRQFQSFAAKRAKENPMITGTMYNVQLATKAILLSSSNKIRKRILSNVDTAMVNMYYRWQYQRNRLAQLYSAPSSTIAYTASVDSVKRIVNHAEKELNIAGDDQVQDKGGNPVDWKQVQALLKPSEAAIEIIRFKHMDRYVRDSIIYVALILTAETKMAPQLVILADGKLLEGRALKFYKNSIATQLEDNSSYATYWATIEPLIKNKTRLYVSLDGVYNEINLNTLKAPDGKYLVDTKNITLLSNTKDLLSIKGRKNNTFTQASASLLGFPKYFLGKEKVRVKLKHQRDFDINSISDSDNTGIAELPGTKAEIEKIDGILASHKWRVQSFTNEEATEEAIKEIRQPGLLHIATHGFFTDEKENTNATDPMLRAGLLFTGAANYLQDNVNYGNDNGILTAYEAANLNLDNTELVILSACETGKGEVQLGEGVYGLQRAFQTAGAKSIIMSLWKVDDTATQELMTSFYENWTSGSAKSEAFKRAQLSLKEKYPNPYYWGAFVMIGD